MHRFVQNVMITGIQQPFNWKARVQNIALQKLHATVMVYAMKMEIVYVTKGTRVPNVKLNVCLKMVRNVEVMENVLQPCYN